MIKLLITLLLSSTVSAGFCSASSKEKYNPSTPALEFMSNQGLAYWYTDRSGTLESSKNDLANFVSKCSDPPVIVVYGIPGKDCVSGESSSGFNTPDSYETFIKNLVDTVPSNSLIILEPDAIALSIDNCGKDTYPKYLETAIRLIPNAYVDVGHWVSPDKVKQLIKGIDSKKLKGFSLNLSNYRSNEEMKKLCESLVEGDQKCLIDTSRNNNGPSPESTWCNYKGAGIGKTGPGEGIIEAYIWIKPAIELDGNCQGSKESYQSTLGAGSKDIEWFNILWSQGFYANQLQPPSQPSSEQPPSQPPSGQPPGQPPSGQPPSQPPSGQPPSQPSSEPHCNNPTPIPSAFVDSEFKICRWH